MPYLYISGSWLLSNAARRVYLIASIYVLVFFGSVIAILLALSEAEKTWVDVPDAIAVLLRALLFSGAVGTAAIWVAMTYFVVGFDRSSPLQRALWCFSFWAFGPIASLLYHFVVYRRQTKYGTDPPLTLAANASAGQH